MDDIYKQTHTEISGVLICENCRPVLPKLQIDSYRVSGNFGERCSCTWNGLVLWSCMVYKAKDRTLMSSRSMWETLRILKPLGLFQDGMMPRFSRHPYLGGFSWSKNAFIPKRWERSERQNSFRERRLAREIKRQDYEKDLTFTDIESMRWDLSLWIQLILRCFPEVDLKQWSRAKVAWIYVKFGKHWQVRSWWDLAIELA